MLHHIRLSPLPMRRVALLCLCLCAAFTASARSPCTDLEQRLTPEQLRETGLDTLTPAQLARLNTLLCDGRGDADAAEGDRHDRAAPQGGDDDTRHIGYAEGPIRSRVKGEVSGWAPGTVFVLENGQQWKVLKGSMTLRKPLQSPEILVVPGVAGRWFLQVDEDMPRPRVYRID